MRVKNLRKAAVLCLAAMLCGCGTVVPSGEYKSQSESATQAETSEISATEEINPSENVPENVTAEETKATDSQNEVTDVPNEESVSESEENSSVAETSADYSGSEEITVTDADLSSYRETANELERRLNVIDLYAAGIFGYDTSLVFQNLDGTREHAKITDGYFYDVAEFRSYINNTLTDNAFLSHYSDLFDGDGMHDTGPRFIDVDGMLYGEITRSRSGGFSVAGEPDITAVSDSSFTAHFGGGGLTLNIVMSGGSWKIDSFSVL
jgi:hypothetical protein